MKVRLREPVVIEAVVGHVGLRHSIEGEGSTTIEARHENSAMRVPVPIPSSARLVIDAERVFDRQEITTSGGVLVAEPDDWILTGVTGERLPCKPDLFERMFEPA